MAISKVHRRANRIFLGTAIAYGLVWALSLTPIVSEGAGSAYMDGMGLVLTGSPTIGAWLSTAVLEGIRMFYDPLYWATQSALIGSVADWFAVNALFRKPLGIPYHTALVPRQRERLIQGLIQLVETHLLTKERCLALLGQVRFLPLLDTYLASDSAKSSLRQGLAQALQAGWQMRTHREWGLWLEGLIQDHVSFSKVWPSVQKQIVAIGQDNRHEAIVITILGQIQAKLKDPAVLDWLSQLVAEETERKKSNTFMSFLVNLAEATNVINHRDMAATILEEVDKTLEVWKQPESPERLAWMQGWSANLEEMLGQEYLQKTLAQAFDQWLGGQDVAGLVETYLGPTVDQALAQSGPGSTADYLLQALLGVWNTYGQKPSVRERLEDGLHHLAAGLLDQSYSLVGDLIRHVLAGLTEEKFVAFIESKVEDELSWIRINGAIVGGVCGLLLWLVLTYVYEPILSYLGLM